MINFLFGLNYIPKTNCIINFVITHISQVIMFSPSVCVCLSVCLSVYVCHNVCPDQLVDQDWCHTNNVLQVYIWGCQVMFQALVTSSMTSPGHKVGQILKLTYLSYSVDQKLKISIEWWCWWLMILIGDQAWSWRGLIDANDCWGLIEYIDDWWSWIMMIKCEDLLLIMEINNDDHDWWSCWLLLKIITYYHAWWLSRMIGG